MDRSQLQDLLELMTPNVYFQPPNGLVMEYPCIRYRRDDEDVQYADNSNYRRTKRYQLTVIDRDPDGVLREMVASIPGASFDRFFTADNLNHDVFNLFF